MDKENEANGEGDDGRGDGDNGSDDNHDIKSAKEVGYEKKPRPSVKNLVKPEKKPTLLGFIRQLPKDFQAMILQKQTKTKTRKRKRTTVQYNKSDVLTNCVRTYQKTLNCQILEQKLFFNDGIKTTQRIVLLQKKN